MLRVCLGLRVYEVHLRHPLSIMFGVWISNFFRGNNNLPFFLGGSVATLNP